MRRWLLLLLLLLALGGLAATAGRWWSPFLQFLGLEGQRLQALASLVSLVQGFIVMVLAVSAWLGFRRRSRPEARHLQVPLAPTTRSTSTDSIWEP